MVALISDEKEMRNVLACFLVSTVGKADERLKAHWAAIKKFKHCSFWPVAKLML